jgi:hypothetical protein
LKGPDANQWKIMSFNKKAAHPTPKFIQDDKGMQQVALMTPSGFSPPEKVSRLTGRPE